MVAIVSMNGNPVVNYTYDAWGNILSITGIRADNLGILNPLRYRGYVYDQETELYYLQSRYYDPAIGRFLNADIFVSTGQGILGNNMFAYCLNNPLVYLDTTGTAPVVIIPIWDYYFIHRRVQEEVSFYYGYAMEVYIRKPDGRMGRLDLYDAENNQFYEVKSIGAAYTSGTRTQIDTYSQSEIIDWRFLFLAGAESPSSGTNTSIKGSFNYSCYTVTYESVPGGLIIYHVDYNTTAIVIASATMVYVAGGSIGCRYDIWGNGKSCPVLLID